MFTALFDTPPFHFLSDYITGWTIIIFIIFILYFIVLRKYYLNKEKFYYSNIDESRNATDTTDDTDTTDTIREDFANNNSSPAPSTPSAPSADSIFNKANQDTIINTTLFDNLQLLPEQVKQCKTKYTSIIINYISEFTKLLKLIKNNKFLNIDREFNIILNKGIDGIISFLNNDIKSMNILTRSSIKTDVLNITVNTINYLVDKENINLTNEINTLAKLNSTTIDYTSMVKNIDVSRSKLEEYIEIDKLISKYGYKSNISKQKVNTVLDKSFILPIYERNFDRINQLVNSDFNDNYTKLAEKYGKAYTDYLNKQKKEDLNINPIEMLSKIESGVVNFLSHTFGTTNINSNSNSNTNLIEQYNADYGNFNNTINRTKTNPLPKQNKNLVNTTTLNKNNIYKDSSNLGNYLINTTTQKEILEGFETSTTASSTTPTPTPTATDTPTPTPTPTPAPTARTSKKPVITNTKPKLSTKNKKDDNSNIIYKLFSGDFLEYVMEIVNSKLSMFYSAYNTQFNSIYDNVNDTKHFNLDENLIPVGFLFFIVSMLFYFIDLTS